MGQNDDGAPPEVVDWARRRLCAQASSATSEHAFSKAGMIIGKKIQQLTADNVGWHEFAGMALPTQWLGRISKESSVCTTGGGRKA